VSDHTHGYDPIPGKFPLDQDLFSKGPVILEAACFIGYRVSVMPGVRIGKGCVIGSHSVVTKNIPDYCMAAGVPAKIIKKYNFNTLRWEPVNNPSTP
jgi:acetyltransferase-like isoleucine patch superfamily enzyme